MTQIERALFTGGVVHCVAGFELAGASMRLMLHPWERPELRTHAVFERVVIRWIEGSPADPDAGLPWDIIGFDAEPIGQGRWLFCLHTDVIEYGFEADWPTITTLPLPPVPR